MVFSDNLYGVELSYLLQKPQGFRLLVPNIRPRYITN